MNRSLLAPGVVSIMLAVLLVIELGGSSQALTGGVFHPGLTRARPGVMHRGDATQAASVILARPVFSTDRRPAHAKEGTHTAATAPRLSAIFVSGASRQVAFDTGGGKTMLAREGGRVGPYAILSIAADRVTVGTGDGTRVLKPTPLPAGDAATVADNAPSPASGGAAGMSLLQQLQRGFNPQPFNPGGPGMAGQGPGSIQGLLARMHDSH